MAWQPRHPNDVLSLWQLKHLPCHHVLARGVLGSHGCVWKYDPQSVVYFDSSCSCLSRFSRFDFRLSHFDFCWDKRVRNPSKRHTLTYIIHLYTSCERTNTGRIRTGHLGVTCFCCDRFLQNLRSHGVKANARSHDATWDAGTRTPLPVAQRHHAAPTVETSPSHMDSHPHISA